MGRYSVKRYKTKRMVRQLDLIYNDLGSKESILKLKDQPLDETKPGLGQFYCIHCAKYFEEDNSLQKHYRSKIHKRRVKDLSDKPYTPLEAQYAGGLNVERFLESVEKHKQRMAHEAEHKAEIEALVTTNHVKTIEYEVPEEKPLEEGEVVMAE